MNFIRKTVSILGIIICLVVGAFISCKNRNEKAKSQTQVSCSNPSSCGESSKPLYCKLTNSEFKTCKETVLKSLRKQVLERKELQNGFAFRFTGTDSMVNVLSSFIKSERHCCDFFTFTLSVKGDSTSAWLQLTGPKEAKAFIQDELAL